jgi:hypothetical protein
MLRRLSAAGLAVLVFAVLSRAPRAEALRSDGYELWTNCGDLPGYFEFLPIYLGGDAPGYIDLGRNDSFAGVDWRVLQYTRDKTFPNVRATTDVWYGGMGADTWPAGTVDVAGQLAAFRVTAWEVDGTRFPVSPSCVVTLETEELSMGLYNVWVRFTEAGTHTLRVFGRQVADFRFLYPFQAKGLTDPLGLGGRRVFLRGESLGDSMDDEFVHTYQLHVVRE